MFPMSKGSIYRHNRWQIKWLQPCKIKNGDPPCPQFERSLALIRKTTTWIRSDRWVSLVKIGAKTYYTLTLKLKSPKINLKNGSILPATLELTLGNSASLAKWIPRVLRRLMGLKTERIINFCNNWLSTTSFFYFFRFLCFFLFC